MAHRLDLQSVSVRLQEFGVELSEYYWADALEPSTRNIMILSHPLKEIQESQLDDFRFVDGVDDIYQRDGRYYVRFHETDIAGLVDFLHESLSSLSYSSIMMLTTNFDDDALWPDPWIMDFDVKLFDDFSEVAVLFSRLGIRIDDRCGIECDMPDDLSVIRILANWYLNRYGRNLYLFCGSDLKILVCHEDDLHFCGKDAALIESIRERAKNVGLTVLPFEKERCG